VRRLLRLIRYLRPFAARIAVALVCMAGYSVAGGISLGLIGPFTQILFSGRQVEGEIPGELPFQVKMPALFEEWLVPWLTAGDPQAALVRVAISLLMAFLLKNLFDYLQSYLMVSVEQGVVRDLRNDLYGHLHSLSLQFFHGERTGQLISRLINDVQLVRGALAAGISNLIKHSLFLLVCIGWIVWASWQLAVVSLFLVPPVALVVVLVGRRIHARSETMQERLADLQALLAETISNIRVVKSFGMENYERQRFARENQAYYKAFVRLRRVGALAGPVAEMSMVLLATGVLAYAGYLIFVAGTLEPSAFFVFLVALMSTISPVKSLSNVNATVQEGLAAAGRVFRLLDTPVAVVSRPGAEPVRPFEREIVLEEVGFHYARGEEVLQDVDLTIRRGEVLALVGMSGAGKSTLVDLLPRFYDPTRGRVTLDGTDLRDLELAGVRALFGLVPQETVLFHDTVLGNIAYGKEDADPAEVEAAARAANAHAFISRLKDGYQTLIGERGVTLSGGERQRLALARAVYKNPPILILDEATSHLDSESERLVQEALERLMEGRTVIVIAHRLSTVQKADRIIVLDRGSICEQGTHGELMLGAGVYSRLHALQFQT
jgi:subfamily B ATP-binding cassette protein MsbA